MFNIPQSLQVPLMFKGSDGLYTYIEGCSQLWLLTIIFIFFSSWNSWKQVLWLQMILPHPLFSVHLTKHIVELPHCWRPKPVQKPLQVWFVLAGLRSDMPGKGKERKWVDQQLSSPPEKACVKPMRKRVCFFSLLWACNTEPGPIWI